MVGPPGLDEFVVRFQPARLHLGLLEFWIDPESPYHHAIFAEPKEFVFFCNLGWRSALAADIAQQMGLNACHIDGGFEAWKSFGGEVSQGKQ